jgi:hypothetical protein
VWILSTLNLLELTSKFRTVTLFVLVHLETIFHAGCRTRGSRRDGCGEFYLVEYNAV